MLLINRFVPLALVILGAITANILLFHLFMAPAGLPLAGLVVTLWAMVFARDRRYFAGIFVQRAE
jgi:hypothetical protein